MSSSVGDHGQRRKCRDDENSGNVLDDLEAIGKEIALSTLEMTSCSSAPDMSIENLTLAEDTVAVC